jgi:7,8-didemethyl-8-hydroxy-5-deazariboflavin synthase
LRDVLNVAGWELVPRLPVYPQYEAWLPVSMQELANKWRIDRGIECDRG